MFENCRNKKIVKPFLRWAGGKSRLIQFLRSLSPQDYGLGTYYEPFLGAGSMFFALKPRRAVISDLNAELIMCFSEVCNRPDLVSRYLKEHLKNNSEKYYYMTRDRYNKSKYSVAKAAMFIYLNKTCFNGIWRVNSKGEFKVPYGYKDPPSLPSIYKLSLASEVLRNTEIRAGDFRVVLKNAQKGDFVYLDPPYPPLNNTAYFTHYTRERFGENDQIAVAELFRDLDKKGCRILLSNADTEFIRSLYKDFKTVEHNVTRWIRSDGKRYKVNEIAVLNYNI